MKSDLLKKPFHIIIIILFILLGCACSASEENQSVEPQKVQKTAVQSHSPFGLYEVLVEDFYTMTREEGKKWQYAFDLLDYEKVLVLGELTSEEDYTRHSKYLEQYLSASKEYLAFLENLETKATENFIAYGLSAKQVAPVVKNLLTTYEKQKATLISLLGTHIDYGTKMQSLLQFLHTKQQHWKLVNNQIDMEDKKLAKQYNAIIDEIVAIEDQIEHYSKELDFHLKK